MPTAIDSVPLLLEIEGADFVACSTNEGSVGSFGSGCSCVPVEENALELAECHVLLAANRVLSPLGPSPYQLVALAVVFDQNDAPDSPLLGKWLCDELLVALDPGLLDRKSVV